MKRRAFIALVGSAAVTWPPAARAQQAAMPVIGFLRSASLANATHLKAAFGEGLREAGFIEGQNVAIEYRSAENRADRLPVLVAELVRRQIVLIVGNTPSALVAKAVTTTVPIVFVTGSDPVVDGLVASLSRGVSFLFGALGTKRLELLRQLVPRAATIAVLVDPLHSRSRQGANRCASCGACDRAATHRRASRQRCDIETAFATFAQRGAGALLSRHRSRSRQQSR
jgi:ABC-type uncharacterized transport system substrate-binding protein